jgi:hypothetical protein
MKSLHHLRRRTALRQPSVYAGQAAWRVGFASRRRQCVGAGRALMMARQVLPRRGSA